MKKWIGRASWITVVVLVSCTPPATQYFSGTFGDTPVNIDDFNTQFDDYNSASPITGETSPFCFSTNRNSSGGQFDIVFKLLDVILDHRNGQLFVGESLGSSSDIQKENSSLTSVLSEVNTASDELGPYLINKGERTDGATNSLGRYQSYIFLYSSGQGGNQDIMITDNLDSETYIIPRPVPFLNSDHNDSYPSVMRDSSAIYFCSDREGTYDIFRATMNKNIDLRVSLEATLSQAPVKDAILSSDGDDKCPFIVNNLMVFASNRSGGFGGYDLYYSTYEGGAWTAPVNFGSKINSSSDDYRPIAKPMDGFTNDMMIFSSNRSGGKGGYDLYYVGIQKIPE